MENIAIKYCFKLPDNTQEIFNLELDARSLELISDIPTDLPKWTSLDFHQCPNCSLDSITHPNCPLMLNLVDIVRRFDLILSYDVISIEVVMNDRCVSGSTTAQRGLSSLMGILIAASACPHTAFLKPMVRFHLPLASLSVGTIFYEKKWQ